MNRRILHTEASNGWGGQEMRILREMIGMRERGHELSLAIVEGGKLASRARDAGFPVLELPFSRRSAPYTLPLLLRWIHEQRIEIVNTHSSWDAWLGGIAARLARRKLVRTRHLSTPIRSGWNSVLLYRSLADFVVTTSSEAAETIARQAGRTLASTRCVPTGVAPEEVVIDPEQVAALRARWGLRPDNLLVGTVCVVRSWKGIFDLMRAAYLLRHEKWIKWVVVGDGHLDQYQPYLDAWGIRDNFIFAGRLEPPHNALAALDIFALLSTGHEGISQASLQAAHLGKPLITTSIGGLPEVCLEGETGYLVPPKAPEHVAQVVLRLAHHPYLRQRMGENAHRLVDRSFLFEKTLNQMEEIYDSLFLS